MADARPARQMRDLHTHGGCRLFSYAHALVTVGALAMVLGGGCGSVNSAGTDAAAGDSGHGGSAGTNAGGSTGAGGSAGAAGSGTGGSTGTGGSSSGSAGTGGGAGGAGRGGSGGAAGSSGSSGSSGGGASGRGGAAGSSGSGGGGASGRGGAGGNAGSTGAAGRGGAAGNAGSGGGGSTDSGGAGGTTSPCQAVLALDRSCSTASDCFAGKHVSNCCGQAQFIGFNNSEKAAFQTLEAQCDATYPACGCAAGQPTADDGSGLRLTTQAGVTCLQGKCTTFVPDCGQPCGAGTTCFSCVSHLQNFAACTTMCTDSTACSDPTLPLCQMGSSGNTSGTFCTAANIRCDTK
jgi:hypothetical protein